MYVLYSSMSCHFKVVYHTGKGIKLNPLPITLMAVLENRYLTAALAFSLFSISFFSPFYSFFFFFCLFLLCVVLFLLPVSCLPPSSSVRLCFSFSISLTFFPAAPKALRAVFLCVPPMSPDSRYSSAV